MVRIFHNPRCSKSREALKLLEAKGEMPIIIEYLKTPPSKEELKEILDMLQMKPHDLIRKGEAEYRENFKGKTLTDDEWIEAMVAYPRLIERPIVINDGKAELGRPPERVLNVV